MCIVCFRYIVSPRVRSVMLWADLGIAAARIASCGIGKTDTREQVHLYITLSNTDVLSFASLAVDSARRNEGIHVPPSYT